MPAVHEYQGRLERIRGADLPPSLSPLMRQIILDVKEPAELDNLVRRLDAVRSFTLQLRAPLLPPFRGKRFDNRTPPWEALSEHDSALALARRLAAESWCKAALQLALPVLGLPADLIAHLRQALQAPTVARISNPDSPAPQGRAVALDLPTAPTGDQVLGSIKLQELLAAGSPQAFQLSDTGLELLALTLRSAPRKEPAAPMSLLALVHACDRMVVLGFLQHKIASRSDLLAWAGAPAALEDAAACLVLVRLLWRLDDIGQSGSEQGEVWAASEPRFGAIWQRLSRLRQGVAAPLPARPDISHSRAVAAQLEGLGSRAAPTAVQSLEIALTSDSLAPCALLLAALELRQTGHLGRLSLAGSPDLAARAVQAALCQGHVVTAALALGIFTSGTADELARTLREEAGYAAGEARAWRDTVLRCETLPPPVLARALAPLDGDAPCLAAVPLRLHLAAEPQLGPAALTQLLQRNRHIGSAVVQAVADWAIEHADSQACAELGALLCDPDLVDAEDLRAGLANGRYRQLFSRLHADVLAAADRFALAAPGLRESTVGRLLSLLQRAAIVTDLNEVLKEVFAHIRQAQVPPALPLCDVDRLFTGPERLGPALQARLSPWVEVAGLQLARNRAPYRRTALVPTATTAGFVLTPTVAQNLASLARAWQAGQPLLLEGPTGCGKSFLVSHLAAATQTPLHIICCSEFTEISDILGRHIPAETQFSNAQIDAMSNDRLAEIVRDWGLPQTPQYSLGQRIKHAQRHPRWADGPLVQAVRRGEAVLLDEINLAPHPVSSCLGSLFDSDRCLWLTLGAPEKIVPRAEFRIYATQNNASDAGRTSDAAAIRAAWPKVRCPPLGPADTAMLVADVLPGEDAVRTQLLQTHAALMAACESHEIGPTLGGAYSVRNLLRTARRFAATWPAHRQAGNGASAVLRREIEEVYGGLAAAPDEKRKLDQILGQAVGQPVALASLFLCSEPGRRFSIGEQSFRRGPRAAGGQVQPLQTGLLQSQRVLELALRAGKAIARGEAPCFYGGAGVGKKTVARFVAHLLQQPYFCQKLHESTDNYELIGSYSAAGFVEGPLLQAASNPANPGTILLDRINDCPTEVLERLNQLLDGQGVFSVPEQGSGRTVQIPPQFVLMAAMNPDRESRQTYGNLSPALLNRFTLIEVPEPSAMELREIAQSIGCAQDIDGCLVDAMVDLHMWVAHRAQEAAAYPSRFRAKSALSLHTLANALGTLAANWRADPCQEFSGTARIYYRSLLPDEDEAAFAAQLTTLLQPPQTAPTSVVGQVANAQPAQGATVLKTPLPQEMP